MLNSQCACKFWAQLCSRKVFPPCPPLSAGLVCSPTFCGFRHTLHVPPALSSVLLQQCAPDNVVSLASALVCSQLTERCPLRSADVLQSSTVDILATARSLYNAVGQSLTLPYGRSPRLCPKSKKDWWSNTIPVLRRSRMHSKCMRKAGSQKLTTRLCSAHW